MSKHLLLFHLFLTFGFANECIVRRAAFDIGSGSTKMAVADVDRCKGVIKDVLMRAAKKVPYEEDITRTPRRVFSRKIMWKGISAIRDLKLMAARLNPSEYVAVGTSVFRRAMNAYPYVRKIKQWTGIPTTILTQKQEGQLGFEAVCAVVTDERKDVVSWDIGAGSMQIATLDDQDKIQVFKGIMASVSFKNEVLQKVKGAHPKEMDSPNPMTASEQAQAFELALSHANRVPKFFQDKLSSKGTQVYGIGGVHYYSITEQVGIPIYDVDGIDEALEESEDLTDEDIGGEYSNTQITNLLLVKGYMSGLGVEDVRSLDINMVNGALINKLFWK